MNIQIGESWVISSAGNNSGLVLGKIPKNKEGQEIDATKCSQRFYYSTIFGAIQGLFKQGIIDSEAQSFLELEETIKVIANQCEIAFRKNKTAENGMSREQWLAEYKQLNGITE